MITDEEYKRMRKNLAEIVSEICANCEKPHLSQAEINLNDPEQCKCHCERVEGICKAMRGIVTD